MMMSALSDFSRKRVRAREYAPREESNTLYPRERQIAALIARGLSNRQIAQETGVTEGTVKQYLQKIFLKLGVRSRLELAIAVRGRNITVSAKRDSLQRYMESGCSSEGAD